MFVHASRITRIVAASLVASLAACGGGSGGGVAPKAAVPIGAPGSSTGSTTPQSSTTFAYGAPLIAGVASLAPAHVGTMSMDVMMQLQNSAGLTAYAAAVSDPASASYRKFLSASDIGSRYGASASDYAKVAAYFRSFGLRVGGWPQRLALAVSGPQSAFEAAFHTHFMLYQTTHGSVYGPKETPVFSAALPVAAVSHLIYGSQLVHRELIAGRPNGQGQNQIFGYAPQQIAAAFDYNGAYAAGFNGAGATIGVIGTGPIDQADYAVYSQFFGQQLAPVTQIAATSAAAAVGGGGPGEGSPTATPPPVTSPGCMAPPGATQTAANMLPACNPEDGEAQLDTEQTAALAPGSNVLFYLAYVPDECGGPTPPCATGDLGPQIGISETDDEIQQAIMDNTADVLSLSFGGAEQGNGGDFLDANGNYTSSGFGPLEFAALAAEGVAVFVSSGDSGAQGCARPDIPSLQDRQCVSYPAGDVSVTSVGGVTVPLDNAGRFIGPVTGWGQQTSGGAGASGGGVSTIIPKPAFQTGLNLNGSFRLQPDLSMIGDPATGVALVANAEFGLFGSGEVGGTSIAAPEMAAMWALVVGACKATVACASQGTGPHPYRLGNAAPLVYRIYNNAAVYPTTFLDVTFGQNGTIPCFDSGGATPCPNTPPPTPDAGFNAGVGFDEVTGVGVPFARHLIKAVVGV